MTPVPEDAQGVTARGSFRVGEATVDLEVTVPSGATSISALLPLVRGFASEVVAVAQHREQQAGRAISCRARCGACCRQLVPLAMTEARHLPTLIAELEPEHGARVRQRFEEAVEALRAADLLDVLQTISRRSREERLQIGIAYFGLGIACPFLEDESCSIHPDRPLSCREYLVTSDPVHCARVEQGRMVRVVLDTSVLNALIRVEAPSAEQRRYVPLVLAPFIRWSQDEATASGPDWLRRIVHELSGVDVDQAGVGLGDAPAGSGAPAIAKT